MAAPSRFAVKLAVGAVRALEAVEGGGAVGAHEAVESGGAVGAHEAVEGGVLSRAVGRGVDLSQEVEVEQEVLWAGRPVLETQRWAARAMPGQGCTGVVVKTCTKVRLGAWSKPKQYTVSVDT